MRSGTMRFITDIMLGRLARWLRLLGQDTRSDVAEDAEIIKVASDESRILISRDRGLVEKAAKGGVKSLYIAAPDLKTQIVDLWRGLGLSEIVLDPDLSRCPICNGDLSSIGKDGVEKDVPPKVLEYHEDFWKCRGCGKTYWMGTHWDNMKKQINDANSALARGTGADGDNG